MNNEEKLLKLLQIAVKNGFDIELLPSYFQIWLYNKQFVLIDSEMCIIIFGTIKQGFHYSLNDLITNFEEDRINFIEALCDNKTIKTNINNLIVDETGTLQVYLLVKNHAQLVQMQWVMQPTSQRLEWLFKTFKHLL